MKAAYLDSSSLLSIAFSEPGHDQIAARIEACEQIFSSNLLEAEIRAAVSREAVDVSVDDLLEGLEWVLPRRPLGHEIRRALAAGYLRGADLWHVACALVLVQQVAPDPVQFVSLDRRQIEVAGRLEGLEVMRLSGI